MQFTNDIRLALVFADVLINILVTTATINGLDTLFSNP
jgi:hypothetical protein